MAHLKTLGTEAILASQLGCFHLQDFIAPFICSVQMPFRLKKKPVNMTKIY